VGLYVAVVHLDVRLGEKAEYLGQQVAFRVRQVAVPVLHVISQRDFFRQPVDPLLGQPRVIGPRIAERLVDRVLGQQVEADRVFVSGVSNGAVHAGWLRSGRGGWCIRGDSLPAARKVLWPQSDAPRNNLCRPPIRTSRQNKEYPPSITKVSPVW